MSEWEPATDAEASMRDALRTDDQESYFRVLAGVDLLLPVSADALAGLAPLGWGTWSTGGRTHVLAFTSPAALQACLADYTGSARRVAYAELADTWPNLEWWLAVNPGLPIEGYLPAWFVAQLSRGDLRLPTRGPARDAAKATQSAQDLQAAALAANEAAGGSPAEPANAGAWGADAGAPAAASWADLTGAPAAAGAWGAGPDPRSGYGSDAGSPPVAGDGRLAPAADRGSSATQVGPGGLPIRTPGAVLPSGLPSRVPVAADGSDSVAGGATSAAPTSGVPAAYRSPEIPTGPDVAGGRPASSVSSQDFAGGRPVSAAPGGGPELGRSELAGSELAGSELAGSELAGSELGRLTRGGFGSGPSGRSGEPAGPVPQSPRGPLPTRTPMAQTPPLPSHLTVPTDDAQPQSAGQSPAAEAPPGLAGSLPRRQVIPPGERPQSMAAAAQALAGTRGVPPSTDFPAPAARSASGLAAQPGLTLPVIPGAGGSGRSSTLPVPAPSVHPTIPPSLAQAPTGSGADQRRPDGAWGEDGFIAANDVERDLYDAANGGSSDQFLSTLLLATVLVPVADVSEPGSVPGDPGFEFQTEEIDGERFLVVFTSRDRLADHHDSPTRTISARFYELISNWPDPAWSFAVNPGTSVGAKYPGPQVIALASWAAEAGLGAEPVDGRDDEAAPAAVPAPERVSDTAQRATVMQKTVPAEQVDYYLDRGYDRVAGFVHRANEVQHLRVPGELFSALGLLHEGSPYQADAKEAFVLRWPAYRPSLYRIPYGGQSEQALRAMDGWVIERPPFRGNGFAPGEGRDVIAEFKVDSVRLPHGAQLWRIDVDGAERMIAVLDSDAPAWRRVGDQ